MSCARSSARCDQVHGLSDGKATTWTRKLKEYLELMSAQRDYPFYYSSRDERGDRQVLCDTRPGPTHALLRRVVRARAFEFRLASASDRTCNRSSRSRARPIALTISR